jgi:hypothetical protein
LLDQHALEIRARVGVSALRGRAGQARDFSRHPARIGERDARARVRSAQGRDIAGQGLPNRPPRECGDGDERECRDHPPLAARLRRPPLRHWCGCTPCDAGCGPYGRAMPY